MATTASVKARLKRLVGSSSDSGVEQRLDHHDHALRDITAALQEVQALTASTVDQRQELVKVQQRLDIVEEHLPEVLSTISTARGTQRRFQRELDDGLRRAENHAASIQELWDRIEMVRRELMFELRYNAGTGSGSGVPAGAEPAVEARIIDRDAVQAAVDAGSLRLNVGCGHIPMADYINVDARELPGVDVLADVADLPFEEGAVDEIHSAHLLEHFPEEQLTRQLLPYWRSRLRPGGVLRAVVPDAAAMLAGHADGSVSFEDLRAVLYGGQEYEGDFHFTMFTAASLGNLLERSGFENVTVEAQGRPNDICLELQVSARRSG